MNIQKSARTCARFLTAASGTFLWLGTAGAAPLPPSAMQNTAPAETESSEALATDLQRQVVEYATPAAAGTIVIDTAQTYLYYVLGNGKAIRYGIGVGRDGFTWSGAQTVTRMAEWPDWTPPQEMIERQPYLPRWMAGGKGNPLGARAIYLGSTVYRIHGTNAPWSVGKYTTHGCIRLRPDDIERLYKELPTGTEVEVIDEPVKMAQSETDTILLEAHPAVSDHGRKILADYLNQLAASDLGELVDLTAARRVLQDTWGIAVDVSNKKHVEEDPTDVAAQQ